MEEAIKTIDTLAKNILPFKAHYLSVDTRRFRQHVDEKRLEEQEIRQLQYTTFVSDAERGILLTRAYFDVREEPVNPTNATNTPLIRKSDPNKPKMKLSLKDYKNRKKSPDGEETPQPVAKPPPKTTAPLNKLPESGVKDMNSRRDIKKEVLDTKPDVKIEARRRRSPSPEVRKRIVEADHDAKPIKRSKVESATPNSTNSRTFKDNTPQKAERHVSLERKPLRDPKATPTNGKLAPNSTGQRGVSPKPSPLVNGSQKSSKSREGAEKKADSHTSSKMPPLLSPIDMSDYMDDTKAPRPSSKKKPADSSNLKPPLKKIRDDRELRKLPPLLSPTLPPIVMEELAKSKLTPPKDSSQKSGQAQAEDSPNGPKKLSKNTKRDETIHVDSNKGQQDSLIVALKYKKRMAKTIERLLALPPGGKKKSDIFRKEERAARDRSDSLEPGTARKRPFPVAEASEASKRPRTSDAMRPSTPPRQSSAMTRVASNSSQAGTPGVANGLTPAAQPPERRRPPVDPEKVHKLSARATSFIQLGTKLKHERDAVLKGPVQHGVSDRERQVAIAAGVQCLVSFLLGFKIQGEAADLERRPYSTRFFKDTLGVIRMIRADCSRNSALIALVLRLQAICLGYIGRTLCSYPSDPELVRELVANNKDQYEAWRAAESARKVMGVYDGSSRSDDGGPIGKLIDRLGYWSTIEEAVPITLEVLRKVMQANSTWKPAEALTKLGSTLTNGVSN